MYLFYGFSLSNKTQLSKQTMQIFSWLVKWAFNISENPVVQLINLTGKKYLHCTKFYFILRYTRMKVHTFTCTIKYTNLLSLKSTSERAVVKRKCQRCPLGLRFEQLSIYWQHLFKKEEQNWQLKSMNSVLGKSRKTLVFRNT